MHPHPNNLALLICCFMAGFLEAGRSGGGSYIEKPEGWAPFCSGCHSLLFAQRCLLARRTGSVFCILANHLSCSHSDGLPFLGFNHPIIPTSVCSSITVSALPFSVSTSLFYSFLFNFWALKTVQKKLPKHLQLFNIFFWLK